MNNQLKPQDLRIGNYVNYNQMNLPISAIRSPKPLKDKRFADKWLIELFDGASTIDCTIEDINPIPLTEEILLMAGFEKLNNTTFKFKDLILDYISTEEHFETEIKYIYGGYKLIPMKYMHIVQNFIFTMYNKELEINLK